MMVDEQPPLAVRVRCRNCGVLTFSKDDLLLRFKASTYTVHFYCPGCGQHRSNVVPNPSVIAHMATHDLHPSDMPLEVWERWHTPNLEPLDVEDLARMHNALAGDPSAGPEREQL